MLSIRTTLTCATGVVCGLLLTGSLRAQPPGKPRPKPSGRPTAAKKQADRPGAVRQVQLFEGARRTVRYFGENLSPSEMTMLRDMERLENEMAYTRDLGVLKRQYVYSERLVEPYRRLVQQYLYGLNTTQTTFSGVGAGGGLVFGVPARTGVLGRGPFGVAGPVGALFGGQNLTVNRSLAYGVGDEGVLKNAMAPVITSQSSPEYAASVGRAYDQVVLRASATPRLAKAMRLPKTDNIIEERGDIARAERQAGRAGSPAAGEPTAPYMVTLKSGEKHYGYQLDPKGGILKGDALTLYTDRKDGADRAYVEFLRSEVAGIAFRGAIPKQPDGR
jgi:hypothetical protein